MPWSTEVSNPDLSKLMSLIWNNKKKRKLWIVPMYELILHWHAYLHNAVHFMPNSYALSGTLLNYKANEALMQVFPGN